MTLSFSQKWGKSMGDLSGLPNYFTEKIWLSLLTFKEYCNQIEDYEKWHVEKFGKYFETPQGEVLYPKLHTIREDNSNRWKAGMKIHFVIHNRTKNRFQFAPPAICKSVQKIAIKYVDSPKWNNRFIDADPWIYKDYNKRFQAVIEVNSRALDVSEMKELATNDGFPSIEAFFNFFNKDFTGKIIHWTDKVY